MFIGHGLLSRPEGVGCEPGGYVANSEAIRTLERGAEAPALELDDVLAYCDGQNENVRWVQVRDLVLADSPRAGGEDHAHIRMLAESDGDLPPIVVQRGTNRVIDGKHRVRAARLRGERAIQARFFDGDDESAFVLSVRLNVRHGLPLSLADRKHAATRILRAHPDWSNRSIASVAGLSHKTVAALRAKAGQPGGPARIGRDGRTRPLSTASGRELARQMLEREPASSLREVSAAAGVSPGTVRDVRDQLRRQAAPVIPRPRRATSNPPRPEAVSPADPKAVLTALRADPSLRLTQSGRLLLSILAVASMDQCAYERLIVDLPGHCVGPVAELAAASVRAWQELATRLDQRLSIGGPESGRRPV
jgi:hypothetical protein